jgi:hypothetical protein
LHISVFAAFGEGRTWSLDVSRSNSLAQFHIGEADDGFFVFEHGTGTVSSIGTVLFSGMMEADARQVAGLLNALGKDQKFEPKRQRRKLKAMAIRSNQKLSWPGDAVLGARQSR